MFARFVRSRYATWIGVGIALAAAFGGGLYLGAHRSFPYVDTGTVSKDAPSNADLAPLYTAWKLLDENFASASTTAPTVSSQDRVYGAIQGLAASLGDPYTTFFPPEEKKMFDSIVSGNFEGVGMEIGIKNDILTVVAPIKDSPAARAGVKTGDLIIKIDGVDSAGLAVDQAVSKIRGKKGTSVTLTLVRDGGAPFEVSIVRDTILLPTVDTTLRPDGIFVIKLYTFDAMAPSLFRDAVRDFANSGSDKLVIDLRGNPGGYLEAAVDLASWFLPLGEPVVTQAYRDAEQNQVYRSRGYDVFTDKLKLVILQDQGSASAAEIFAGALQEHHKGTVIGTRSFGKGSVQQVFPVTPDTSLKITVARWLTPNGVSISQSGLTPDIKVERTEDDAKAGKDPQMDRAVQFLLSSRTP